MPERLLRDRKEGLREQNDGKTLRKSIPLLKSAVQQQRGINVKRIVAFLVLAVALFNIVYQFEKHLHKGSVSSIPKHCHARFPFYTSGSPTSLDCRIERAKDQHQQRLKRQSRTVADAKMAYRKRYRRKPPQGFGAWADFALQHNSTLIDDYDQIELDLIPFRKAKAMNRAAWRRRISKVKLAEPGEMLGSISVSNGEVIVMGPEQGSMSSNTLESILRPIAPLLPDMTILYNWYAEPRVLKSQSHYQSNTVPSGGNPFLTERQRTTFSKNLQSISTNNDIFANFTQLNTFDLLAQSCPSNTLVSNTVSFLPNSGQSNRDLCRYMKEISNVDKMHGFFAGPDEFLPTYELVPLLSRAKLSVFGDILAPNVCYGHQDYRYWNELDAIPFANKSQSIYWRGSMTGLATSSTNWIYGHRHRLIGYIQSIRAYIDKQHDTDATTSILPPPPSLLESLGQAPWTLQVEQALAMMNSSVFDAAFTDSPPNCPKDVCNAISKEMPLQKAQLVDESFKHQFVLDLDGQSMSCRFYSLLESNSVVFKQTIWGEWHDERLIPWLHYVPIDIDLTKHEVPLYMDWFTNTAKGQQYGAFIAKESRKWARNSLRKIDLSIYFHRLLLELAEVMN